MGATGQARGSRRDAPPAAGQIVALARLTMAIAVVARWHDGAGFWLGALDGLAP
ncbi:hypothetical protein GCM10018780_88960 [Streptomyces lanatus]|nr:hypothetical protein GCM10018780_88960 [Streptomyces lanatus]